jgi:hypothetical protein
LFDADANVSLQTTALEMIIPLTSSDIRRTENYQIEVLVLFLEWHI